MDGVRRISLLVSSSSSSLLLLPSAPSRCVVVAGPVGIRQADAALMGLLSSFAPAACPHLIAGAVVISCAKLGVATVVRVPSVLHGLVVTTLALLPASRWRRGSVIVLSARRIVEDGRSARKSRRRCYGSIAVEKPVDPDDIAAYPCAGLVDLPVPPLSFCQGQLSENLFPRLEGVVRVPGTRFQSLSLLEG